MCGGLEAGEDALLGEEEGTGADGKNGAFTLWVLLLEIRKGFDEAEGLGFVLEHFIDGAAGDDENVKLAETGIGLFVVHVGSEAGTSCGYCMFGGRDKGWSECFGFCEG